MFEICCQSMKVFVHQFPLISLASSAVFLHSGRRDIVPIFPPWILSQIKNRNLAQTYHKGRDDFETLFPRYFSPPRQYSAPDHPLHSVGGIAI